MFELNKKVVTILTTQLFTTVIFNTIKNVLEAVLRKKYYNMFTYTELTDLLTVKKIHNQTILLSV